MVNIGQRKLDTSAEFFTTSEIAKVLGVSRIAVFKKIQEGKIQAKKVGRNYIIPRTEFEVLLGQFVTDTQKQLIDDAVKKAVKEYSETFKLLGRE